MSSENRLRDRVCVVGIGQTAYSRDSGRSELSLAVEAARGALDDAGLRPDDVDGVLRFEVDRVAEGDLAACLGIRNLGFFAMAGPLGTAACGLVSHGAAAIISGLATTVVIYRSLNGRSAHRFGGGFTMRAGTGDSAFTEPYGLLVPPQGMALIAREHMHRFGTTVQHLGSVAITLRDHACMNPKAVMYGKPITMEDYLASRIVAEPLRLFDCCLETDGACAIVMVSAERARTLRHRPVYVMAAAQNVVAGGRPHPRSESPTKYLAQRLYPLAGVGPQDIDCLHLYDPSTISVITELEGYGFCPLGEGGPFVEAGNIRGPGGTIPVNTAGGNMSEVYLQGLNHLIEAVRQVRGTSTCQVPDCKLVQCDSGGGSGGVILRR